MLEKAKAEKMAEHVSLIQDEYREECAKVTKEIEAVFLKAREMRAKLVLTLLEAHEKYKTAQDLRRELNDVERIAGVQMTFRTFVPDGVPVRGDYTPYDYGIIPSESELKEVYREGKLQRWVEHYATTGEVTTNDELNKRPANPNVAQGAKGLIGRVLGKSS